MSYPEADRRADEEMKLPAGKACADCVHFRRCKSFIGISGRETKCDWHPSRFREKIPEPVAPLTGAEFRREFPGEVTR